LVPENTKCYGVFVALSERETYWRMNAKIAVGVSVGKVLATDVNLLGMINKVRPFINANANNKKNQTVHED